MKEKLMLVLGVAIIALNYNCSSPDPVEKAVDPLAALNAELTPARVQGYDLGVATPHKAKLAQWDKTFLPVIKAVYDKLPPGTKLEIRGHCDSTGTNQENIEVGENRAKVMYDYLVKKGFKKDNLAMVSKGEEKLLDEKDPESENNRRVNFRVIQK